MSQDSEQPLSWFGELNLPTSASDDIRPEPSVQSPAFGWLYTAFMAARAVMGILLLIGLSTSWLMERQVAPTSAVLILAYTLAAWLWWFWPQKPYAKLGRIAAGTTPLVLSAVMIDVLFFTALSQFNFGISLNLTALLALPVLMASVLLRRILAFGVAAGATLLMISVAVLNQWIGNDLMQLLTTAGLSGIGFFLMALIVSELALRLSLEQRSSQDHMDMAKQQVQLNRLVIEEMPEGVLVIDRSGLVRSANPSARKLLAAFGKTGRAPFQLRGVPAWEPLVTAIQEAFAAPDQALQPRDILLTFDDQTRRGLRMRLKFSQQSKSLQLDEVCVVLLEDIRQISAKVRQEKLAAMGRMSAAVAHEIRNPLAAIAQANALLAEDLQDKPQQQLVQMVADNVKRLKRIVDDIMHVSPSDRGTAPSIDIRLALRDIYMQWSELHPAAAAAQHIKLDTSGLPLIELQSELMIRFDPDHLRRIIVNLLDNAMRHCSQTPGAILVQAHVLNTAVDKPLVMLSVFNDGPAIEVSVERALFEPFFSTRSRGTGLGLYICKELCEQYRSTIDYRSHPPTSRHRHEFFIIIPIDEIAVKAS